jgi:hypothetical protein
MRLPAFPGVKTEANMQRHSAVYGLAGAVALVLMSTPLTLTDAVGREQSGRQASKQYVARHVPTHARQEARYVRARVVTPFQGNSYGSVAEEEPVIGMPFGYSGCYSSREQVYVAGQGLVWRPRVDCPYQDVP